MKQYKQQQKEGIVSGCSGGKDSDTVDVNDSKVFSKMLYDFCGLLLLAR